MSESGPALASLRAAAGKPFEEASALPPDLYHDPGIYRLERERIFAREWLCAGLAAEIPEPGDYLTFQINDQPILVIRGDDGEIRALSNVCRHRMMVLLAGSGNCRRIVCPYHAWSYDVDGRLVGAPHTKRTAGFDASRIRLPRLRAEVWQGWIYVTLNEAAPALESALAALEPLVAPYAMAGYVPVARQDHVWKTNWKLLTENFMEGYHLPVAHRKTVGAWFPAEETTFPQTRFEAFTFQTFVKDENARYGRAHPANTRLQGHLRYTSLMPTIFPSHMIVLAPDHFWYLSLMPKSVGEVRVRFGVALAPEVHASLADPDGYTRELVAFFDAVNEEDRFIVEQLFEGTRAPLAQPGRLSWLERELHDFARYLEARLEGRADVEHPSAYRSRIHAS